jgi:Cys-rich repeat protein
MTRALIPAVAFGFLLGAALSACPSKSKSGSSSTCESRADCTGGEICEPEAADANSPKACGPCQLNNQCNLDEQCDPTTQRCKFLNCFGDACKLNNDCSLGEFCVQGLCLDPRNNNLSNPDACNVVNCTTNADCETTQVCNLTNNVCELNLGCGANAPCPANEVCNVAANICTQGCTAANATTVCGVKEVCYMGLCVQCVEDSDCGAGLSCDLTKHLCVGQDTCLTDRDCSPPLVCNALTSLCTTNPGQCLSDMDCPSDQTCEITDGTCVPTKCTPDRFTPASTMQPPSATYTPMLPTGETDGLTLCGGAPEYFSLALQNGDEIDVVVDSDALTQMTIAILDPSGTQTLALSNNLAVSTIVSRGGTYFIEAVSNDLYVTYGLTISITRGTPCPAGPGAPNDTYLQAKPEAQGNQYGLSLCPGDQDWFEVAVSTGQTLTATLTTTVADGELDLYLYDSNGTTLLDSSTTPTNNETVSSNAFTGPHAYVHVQGADSATQNVYSLSIDLSGP